MLLHFHREDDIDGAEIPVGISRICAGPTPLMVPVLVHNEREEYNRARRALLWSD